MAVNQLKWCLVIHVLAVYLLLGALQPAAAKSSSKAAAQHNSTFSTCNTGTSRLRLANLEQLPAGCRPGHSGVGSAVLDCFRTSKVTVKDCRVNVKPKAKSKSSQLPPVCKVLHVQGRLHGPSNATLLGVLSETQFAKYTAEHPEALAGSNATQLQQHLLSNLALLFGRAVLRSKSNCTKAGAAGSNSSSDYQGRRHHTQPKRHPAPKPAPLPAAAANASVPAPTGTSLAPAPAAGATSATAAADSTAANASAVQPEQQASAAAKGTPAVTGNASSSADAAASPPGAAAAAAASNTSSPATAEPLKATLPPAGAATAAPTPSSNSSSGSSSNNSSSAAPTAGGRRRLRQHVRLQHQQQLRRLLAAAAAGNAADDGAAAPAVQLPAAVNVDGSGAAARVNAEGSSAMDASALKFSTKPALPAADAAPRPAEASDSASESEGCSDEHTADGDADADADAAAAAVAVGKTQAKLYRQGSSLIVQTHSSCQFQFVVTKNIGVMQPAGSPLSSSSIKGSSAAAAGAHGSRPGSKAAAAGPPLGWYLPSWVVFTAVSVVMAVLVCVMAARLAIRVRERLDYSVLQTQEAPVELATGPFPSSAARSSQAAAAATGQQDAAGDQQLQLPISSRAAGSRPGSRAGSSSGMKLGAAAAAAAAAAGSAAAASDDGRAGRDAAQAQDTDTGDSRQLLRGQVRSDGSMPRSSSRGRSVSGGGTAAGKDR